MSQNKPLFIPWLQQQIDSCQFPGVQWINAEHTLFTVPWKHALRQDSHSDDVLIFRAWAQTGVGPDGRLQGDPSVWKRNFRSALRARGFTVYQDNKNDGANPHKVYKWPEDGQSGESREGSQDYDCELPVRDDLYLEVGEIFTGSVSSPDLLEQCLVGLNITGPEQVGGGQYSAGGGVGCLGSPSGPVGGVQYSAGGGAGCLGSPSGPVGGVQYSAEGGAGGGAGCLGSPSGPVGGVQYSAGGGAGCLGSPSGPVGGVQYSAEGGAGGGAGCLGSPAEDALVLGQFSPLEAAFTAEPVLGQQVPVQENHTDSGHNSFSTHYKVTVHYKGAKVLDQLVENEAGFRLVSRSDLSLSADGLTVLELPGTDHILDQTQAKSTREILDNLGGLEVRKEAGLVLGRRWGDSRVYWGLCKHERSSEPRPLAKKHPEPIYHFKTFPTELIAFIEKRAAQSPSYSLFFCLGQTWPDPKNKPWEKKLITVEVVLTVLERLKMMAVEGGASSLQSDELQISLDQLMELD